MAAAAAELPTVAGLSSMSFKFKEELCEIFYTLKTKRNRHNNNTSFKIENVTPVITRLLVQLQQGEVIGTNFRGWIL